MELILYTDRLILAACSSQLSPLLQNDPHLDLPHIQGHLIKLDKEPSLYGWGPWLILHREHEQVIGDIGFKGQPDHLSSVEVGYGILPHSREKGYATESLKILMHWAFHQKNVQSIKAECRHDNRASIRVLEKVDMIRTGEEHQMVHWFLNSKERIKNPIDR
ncbi:GNAT family N-acetyltransferase [Salipaludibacillus neizhouensis]|uniref:GNAT family N-acetyltransferase n=1 Tax=Salipaludibacillus neizhouensis TaxID=885475 RepID=A0A3A9K9S7_9BACI|nr:GNAT family N-acetyltransferase [Salipaludibacillus neizhouensis]RKL66403.1 GNAT family N-acetyltransferase [Salipaludibacillus neizhouensis]